MQILLLSAVLIWCACSPALAQAVPILGEARSQDGLSGCASYLVKDGESGKTLAESNVNTPYPNFGGSVRWMTALVALDYLSFSDMVEAVRRYDEDIPEDAVSIEIRRNRVYSIRDLTAAMLLPGAMDAALMLRNLTLQKLGEDAGYVVETPEEEEYYYEEEEAVEDIPSGSPYNEAYFIQLMNQKAAQIGLQQTFYTNVTGEYDEAQTTTAADQLLLLENLCEHKLLSKLASQETYTLESGEAGFSSFRTAYSLMSRQSASYDTRVKTMSKGMSAAGVQCSLIAQSGAAEIYVVLWCPGFNDAQADESVLQALDHYMGLQRINIRSQLEELVEDVKVTQGDALLTGWSTGNVREFLCFAQPSFVMDAERLSLEVDEASLAETEDEAWQLRANLFYDGQPLGEVQLRARERTVPVSAQAGPGAQMEIYASQPASEPESWVEEYMWLLIIAATALLAIVVYSIGRILRERMED